MASIYSGISWKCGSAQRETEEMLLLNPTAQLGSVGNEVLKIQCMNLDFPHSLQVHLAGGHTRQHLVSFDLKLMEFSVLRYKYVPICDNIQMHSEDYFTLIN